ncbi:extracellular solute-binding protein [Paenibacillus cymbidii]|uniref:extracellular solute-binding protein n=1 Tax=Paenibacillus cymbidii TaxID=1639034 RepID=UPI001436B8C7|nr:extracellular solute-binding protein [Paenibacillus cymbidii]
MKKKVATVCTAAVLLTQTAWAAAETPVPAPVPQEQVREARQPLKSPWDDLTSLRPSTDTLKVWLERSSAIMFEQELIIDNDSTFAPYRSLLEALGFRADWNEAAGQITAAKDKLTIVFTVDSDKALANGESRQLPAPVRLHDGVPYVPLRFVAEEDKREVTWDGFNRSISIGESLLGPVRIEMAASTPAWQDAGFADLSGKLEKATGNKLSLTLIGGDMYLMKMNVMLAAGEPDDIMLLPDSATYSAELVDSLFWDLTPYLADYPHLAAQVKLMQEHAVSPGGKVYGIPLLQSPFDGRFPVIRQDWLDVFDLPLPTTMEELYAAMQAFTQRDPDGNGKNDTLGMTGAIDGAGLGGFAWIENVFNESGGRLAVRDGRAIDTVTEPGTRDALKWLYQAYAEGLAAKDFPVVNAEQAQQLMNDGRAGLAAMTLAEARETEKRLQETNPRAKLTPLVSLRAPGGEAVVPLTAGNGGSFAVPRQVTAAKLPLVLAFLDRVYALAESGAAAEGAGLNEQDRALLAGVFGSAGSEAADDAVLEAREAAGFAGQILLDRPIDMDDQEAGISLAQRIQQAKLKYVLGATPIAAWDLFVGELKADASYSSWLGQRTGGAEPGK